MAQQVPLPTFWQSVEAGVPSHGLDDTEESDLMSPSSGEDANIIRSWWRPLGLATSTLAVVTFIAVALAGQGMTETAKYGPVTGRQLFESPAIIDATTEAFTANAVRRGEIQPAELQTIKLQVASGLRALIDQLPAETQAELENTHLSGLQHQAVADKLRIRGDSRVQRIGLEVVRAVQEGDAAGDDLEGLRHRIQSRLRPRIAELRKLQDELFTAEERETLGKERSNWEGLLSTRHLEIMRRFGKGHKGEIAASKSLAERRLTVAAPVQATQPVQQYQSLPAQPVTQYVQYTTTHPAYVAPPTGYTQPGVQPGYNPYAQPVYTTPPPDMYVKAEEMLNTVETALDSMRLMCTMAGKSSPLPPEAKTLLDSSSYFTQFIDCELDAVKDATAGSAQGAAPGQQSAGLSMTGAMKGMMCPEEMGTQGNRAIANTLADFGIDGSPFFNPSVKVSKSSIFS